MKLLTLLILMPLLLATSPPAFPDQSSGILLNIHEAGSSQIFPDQTLTIYLPDGSTTLLHTGPQGRAVLYMQNISGFLQYDAPATPQPDFRSTQLSASSQDVPLFPVGVIRGIVRFENASPAQARITLNCDSPLQPEAATPDSNGAYSIIAPAGACQVSTELAGFSATSNVTVRQGYETEAILTLGAASSQFPWQLALAAIAVILLIAAAAYFIMQKGGRRQEKKAKSKSKPRSRKLTALLLLMAFASFAYGVTVSQAYTQAEHTYDFSQHSSPTAQWILATGSTDSIDGCSGRVVIEFSDDGATYVQVGSIETISPQPFRLNISQPGAHRFYRLRAAECWLRSSKLELAIMPDFTVALQSPSPIYTGVPVHLNATIRNLGGTLQHSQTDEMRLTIYHNTLDEQNTVTTIRLNSSNPAWAENGTYVQPITWVPSVSGPQTLYAKLDPIAGEADASNNMAQIGVYAEPGPGEARSTELAVTAMPSEIPVSSPQTTLSVTFRDTLTTQSILGATCTASNVTFNEQGSTYVARLNFSQKIGVNQVSISCVKSGYAPASYNISLPVITEGGHFLTLLLGEDGKAHGQWAFPRTSLASQRIRIRVERLGPEHIGLQPESILLNDHLATAFETDAGKNNGSYWLDGDSTYATYTFDAASLPGQQWTIQAAADAMHGARLNIVQSSILSPCVNVPPSVTILPAEQSGEIGTALIYAITVTSHDSPDCDPAEIELSTQGRPNWRYELASAHLLVSPGSRNFTFITVTPPEGELPGTYEFRVYANSSLLRSSPPYGSASYSITSQQKFSRLSVEASQQLQQGPGATFMAQAIYTDASNHSFGACQFTSTALRSQSIPMHFDVQHSLVIDVSSLQPGNYSYAITCREQGFRTSTYTGSFVISQTAFRGFPLLSLTPHAAVNPSEAGSSRTIKLLITAPQCTGSRRYTLTAASQFQTQIEPSSPSLQCGSTTQALLKFTVPQAYPTGIYGLVVTATDAENPAYNSSATLLIAVSSNGLLRSCHVADAFESPANLIYNDNPCRNWNEHQTYEFPLSNGTVKLHATGSFEFPQCTFPLLLEASDDGLSFSRLKSISPNSPQFNFTSEQTAHRFYRLSSSCLLKDSALLEEPATQSVDLVPTGISTPRITLNEPANITIFVSNRGGASYSSSTLSLFLRTPAGDEPLQFPLLLTAPASSEQSQTVAITLQHQGDLLIRADSLNEINESDESNNELIAPLAFMPAQGISKSASPGWNLIPHVENLTTGCGELIRFDSSSQSYSSNASIPSGAWVFANISCSYTASLPSTRPYQLVAGHNLVPILPWMVGNPLTSIQGDCNILSTHFWNSSSQRWEQAPAYLDSEQIGTVLEIRASGACEMR